MLIFYFLLSRYALSTLICPQFDCGVLPSGTCIQYIESENTNVVQPCPSGYSCPYSSTTPSQSVVCTLTPTDFSYPGEPCSQSSDCNTNLCQNSICIGIFENQPCNTTLQCAPGLYCYFSQTVLSFICSPLIKTGNSGCLTNSDCEIVSYCNFTGVLATSICIGSFSLLPGVRISNCYNGLNYLCQNLYCTTNIDGSFCTDKVTSLNALPVSCTSDWDCMSTTDRFVGGFYLGSCVCGNNNEGSSYCSLFPGDWPYTQYIEVLSSWLNSKNVSYCNSDRGLSENCISAYYSYSVAYSYYKYYVQLFPQLQNNYNCVKNTITYGYWDIEQYLANQTVLSSAGFLFITFNFFLW